jgi:hypothetical protein
MTQYENYPEREYAVESNRNILETPAGRMKIGLLEAGFESLINERIDEEFSDD